jgi:tetratricopeptide (TPR) repeat protein
MNPSGLGSVTPHDGEESSRPLRVFLSYAHDEFAEIAERLWRDLKDRGHEVWFDRADLHAGYDWEIAIEEGLDWVADGPEPGYIILLMTPHAVRRPDGFCLNEISRAFNRRIPIVPVMLVDVLPPLTITRIQWLDLRDCVPIDKHKPAYEQKLPLILSALEHYESLHFEGEQARLHRLLDRASYENDIAEHLPRFVGRRWLFRRIDEWLADPHAGPVLFICGGPGSGKSAIAAWLCQFRPEVRAFHMCRFSDQRKADPAQAVRSIAWQLSTQIPDYLTRLSAIPTLETSCETATASTLFAMLIVEPLANLPVPDGVFVIVIDALDEATHQGRNELAAFLAEASERLPKWLRLIVTSRPDSEVVRRLQSLEPLTLEPDSDENLEDLREYVNVHIAQFAPDGVIAEKTVEQLQTASEGNWLYLHWIRRELEAGRLSLDAPEQFPKGLGSVYGQFFERRFHAVEEYERTCRPFLEVILAACEPVTVDMLRNVLGWSSYDVNAVLRAFGSLVDRDGDQVRLFHRSASDWLVNEEASAEYAIDRRGGDVALADFGWAEYTDGVEGMSDYSRRWLATHLEAVGRSDDVRRFVTDARCVGEAFLDGRHLELAHFWADAGAPEFVCGCEASYSDLARSGESALLYAAARGIGQLFEHCGVYGQAIEYFKRALDMSHDDEAIGFTHLDIGWCLRDAEGFDEAIAHAERAIESFRACGNVAGEGRAESTKGICYWHLQEDLTALEHLERARTLCAAAGDARAEHEALNHIGIVRRGLGQYEKALTALHETEAFYTKIKDLRGLGKVCNSLGTAYWWSGQYDEALSFYARADDFNERTNQHYVAGLTANNLGYLHLERGDPRAARDAFTRGLEIRRRLRLMGYEMMDLAGLALAYYYLGDVTTARRLSQEAVNGLEHVESVEDLVRAYYNHHVIMAGGDPAESASASHALARARELVRQRIDRLDDRDARAEFIARVPLIRDLVDVEATVS